MRPHTPAREGQDQSSLTRVEVRGVVVAGGAFSNG